MKHKIKLICLTLFFLSLISAIYIFRLLSLQSVTEAAGNTYYVATTGDDLDPGTQGEPFATLAKGISVLTPGDTLLVRAGTYTEAITTTNIPSGTDWNSPVTIKAEDENDRPILMPIAGTARVFSFATKNGVGQQYIVIDGFIMDGTNIVNDVIKISFSGADSSLGANHIRIKNSEIRNSPNQGILVTSSGSQYNEFINLYVHNNGVDAQLDHGIYISTGNNLIENSTIENNGAFGIHLYNEDDRTAVTNNIVRNNKIYNHAVKFGMIVSSGADNLVYNNLIYDNAGGGISVGYQASGSKIYNNTIYSNSGRGVVTSNVVTGTKIYNNIISSNGGRGIYIDGSTGTEVYNNVLYQNSAPIFDGGTSTVQQDNITTDPQLVDPVNFDFHLESDSPAVDSGFTLADVTTDYESNSRPQGSAYDIGAFEYTVAPTSTPTPTNTPTPTPTPSPTPTSIPAASSSTSSSTQQAAGAPEKGQSHCPLYYKECPNAGPIFNKVMTVSGGTSAGNFLKMFIEPQNSDINLKLTITRVNPYDVRNKKGKSILPWQNGYNIASELYSVSAISAFNGYPVELLKKPSIILLSYDPTLLYGRNPKELRIGFLNKEKNRWEIISANTVINTQTHTIANTTQRMTVYTVLYPTRRR